MRVFVDTSALLAVLDEDDVRHREAAATFRSLLATAELVTHNYVHVEALAVAGRRLGRGAVDALASSLLPAVTTIWIDEAAHAAALEAHRAGVAGVSFVDEVSFAVMRREGLEVAFAFDADFERHGFSRPPVGEPPPPRRLSETRAPYGTTGETPWPADLVSVTEIAARSGRPTNTVQSWRRRHRDFPTPIASLAAGPVWHWPDVAGWLDRRARPSGPSGSGGPAVR